MISITGYKPTLFVKDKILENLKEKQITFSFRDEVVEFGKNIDLTGQADKLEAMKRCRESKCHFLRYGKIYKCPFEALANKCFEYYKLDIRFSGGYNIYDETLDWKVMVERLLNCPVDACKYCGAEEKIQWETSNKPNLDDWVI